MDMNAAEIARGERFEFGQNWSQFLADIDDDRIQRAESSLKHMLQVESLAGKSFLDIGSGSGLFSLAARPSALGFILSTSILSRFFVPGS